MSEVANPTSAQQAVWSVVADIPRGRVMTYGEVADRAGLGRAARMVSSALQNAPGDMALPWQRVINSMGKISFPKGSTAYIKQHELLLGEGVVFINGRVNLKVFRVEAVIDEKLWSVFFE